MSQDTNQVNTWIQGRLIPPDYSRITGEIIVDQVHDLITFNIRVRDDDDGNFVGAWSLPLRSSKTLPDDLSRFVAELTRAVNATVYPFLDA